MSAADEPAFDRGIHDGIDAETPAIILAAERIAERLATRSTLTLVVHLDEHQARQLDRIEHLLKQVLHLEKEEIMDLTNVTEMVTNLTTVDESAKALLTQLFAAVEANINDPAALQAIVDQGNAETQSLADAITANTPAAPAV